MTKELTHGKPLPLILQFAFPLILGYMLQQLYSLCDTVIVGRCLGVNELAAVGSTGAVSFLVVGFATGMCTVNSGCTGIRGRGLPKASKVSCKFVLPVCIDFHCDDRRNDNFHGRPAPPDENTRRTV